MNKLIDIYRNIFKAKKVLNPVKYDKLLRGKTYIFKGRKGFTLLNKPVVYEMSIRDRAEFISLDGRIPVYILEHWLDKNFITVELLED